MSRHYSRKSEALLTCHMRYACSNYDPLPPHDDKLFSLPVSIPQQVLAQMEWVQIPELEREPVRTVPELPPSQVQQQLSEIRKLRVRDQIKLAPDPLMAGSLDLYPPKRKTIRL